MQVLYILDLQSDRNRDCDVKRERMVQKKLVSIDRYYDQKNKTGTI
jgi:hypothetical protein